MSTRDSGRKITGWHVFLVLVGLSPAWAASAWCGWRTFTTADGLGGNSVLSMLEDRSGNLWLGILGGVSRYDGSAWRTFTTGDGLVSNGVTSMLEDRSGNLWFGTIVGVSRFDGVSWTTFTTAGLGDIYVTSMLEDRSGNLWFGTSGGGVSRYDGSSWTTFTTADGLGSNYITSMLEDRSGNLWFGTNGVGVSRYDGSVWTTFTTVDGLGSHCITSMLEDRSGNLWFGIVGCGTDSGGVSRYDGSAWRTFTTADGPVGNGVSSMLEDRSGNLWFGTFGGGVSRYDGSAWRTFTTGDGLVSNRVSSMLEDRSGNLWFGTENFGVSRYDGSVWTTFSMASLGNTDPTSMLEDRSGKLWLGTLGGVSRYDGLTWRTFTTTDGLVSNRVTSTLEDRSGNLWFGTDGGVSRFDGVSWTTFTTADGLVSNRVTSMLEDRSGNLWFGTDGSGVSRYDGSVWTTFTAADGLASNYVTSMLQDLSGGLWFGTLYGGDVSRYDGSAWRTFATGGWVLSMLEDRSGNLWFGTYGGGVSRYDGSSWRNFTAADGLGSYFVDSILEDRSGSLWFGTYDRGVSRYDGSTWRAFTAADGLGSNYVTSMLEDRSGNLWFGTAGALGTGGGVSRYEPDRVSPQTIFLSVPPRLTPARSQTAVFAAFGETDRIEFSYRLDGAAWSPWSSISSWFSTDLPDGSHLLEAQSRDFLANADPTPAKAIFEIDGTPPAPVIASPQFGQAVRGAVDVRGSAADARFVKYRLEVRPGGAASWNSPDATVLIQSTAPVETGLLAAWNTSALTDGNYDLRISVTDSLGLTGVAQVTVVVDNHFPYASETSPAVVTATAGGDLYTTNQELHLYFPPHAFDQDALVSIAAAASVTDTLPSGAIRVLPGYDISWSAASLRKPAALAFSTAGKAHVPGTLAVYSSSDGIAWQRLGGTPDNGKVSLAVRAPGRYALFAESSVVSGSGTLAGLAFTPRVFSPTGAFASSEVGISFTLGRPAPVTVRVYSRSGRLVREVVAGQSMNAGANLVRWDGRDRNGGFAVDGLYLVTVEALGRTERKTLAVVK